MTETREDLSYKIKEYISKMPSLPVSVNKVLEICGNINASPVDLNQVISLDPVLTGKLLHLINSAYYGIGNHITSLVKAITMLGLNSVKNLALSTAVLGNIQKSRTKGGLNFEGFWHHSLCVGVISKLLAKKSGVESKYHEEYFTAGLLHDIGKIPLNAVLTSDYLQMVITADFEHKTLYAAESENLEINHCAAGELIARSWNLDSSIIDVIAHHHNALAYSGENANIVCNVSAANYFSVLNEVGFAGDRKPVKPEKPVWNTIGLEEDVYMDIIEKLYSEIERAKVFLHIH